MEKKFYWQKFPQDEVEFESMMLSLNSHLDSLGIEIHMKPFTSIFSLSEAFGGTWKIEPSPISKDANDLLLIKVFNWLNDLYGNKLLVDFSLATYPILIKNDSWQFNVPNYYNEKIILRTEKKPIPTLKIGYYDDIPTLCIQEHIENIKDSYLDILNQDELNKIYEDAKNAILGFRWVYQLAKQFSFSSTDFITLSIQDYKSSSNNFHNKQYNNSAWDSLQATEKLIKKLLQIGNFSYLKGADGHDLLKLAQDLKNKTYIDIDLELLKNINFHPKIRYGEIPISVE
jgi:hypothetical protein